MIGAAASAKRPYQEWGDWSGRLGETALPGNEEGRRESGRLGETALPGNEKVDVRAAASARRPYQGTKKADRRAAASARPPYQGGLEAGFGFVEEFLLLGEHGSFGAEGEVFLGFGGVADGFED